ncbi:MAG: hypothetical protein LOY00_11960, partial [Methylocaldum sp.]|nr:hypothetical protein [Methylocaldum sp.]
MNDVRTIRSKKNEGFGVTGIQIDCIGVPVVAAVFFQYCMEVGTSETEGAYATASRMSVRVSEPRPSFGIDIKGTVCE